MRFLDFYGKIIKKIVYFVDICKLEKDSLQRPEGMNFGVIVTSNF